MSPQYSKIDRKTLIKKAKRFNAINANKLNNKSLLKLIDIILIKYLLVYLIDLVKEHYSQIVT